MSTGTYKRGVSEHARYSQERHDKYDDMGRQRAKEFLTQEGYTVRDNDKDAEGKTIYVNTDQVGFRGSEILFADAEVKSEKNWAFIRRGVDVPDRKRKYYKEGVDSVVIMSNEQGTELLVIPLLLIELACRDCENMYAGRGEILSTSNFEMPVHGCHRIKKKCWCPTNKRWTNETFACIPFKYVKAYEKVGDVWKLYKDAQPLDE
jgi:hypothetical protein